MYLSEHVMYTEDENSRSGLTGNSKQCRSTTGNEGDFPLCLLEVLGPLEGLLKVATRHNTYPSVYGLNWVTRQWWKYYTSEVRWSSRESFELGI